ERAHLPYSAETCGNYFFGVDAGLFTCDVIAGKLTESVKVCIVRDLLKSKLAAESFEVGVIRMCEREGEVHVITPAETHLRFLGDNAFTEGRKRHRQLDCRAGLGSARERHLLIHHGQNAPAGGLDREDSTIHIAQCVDGRLTHNGIFTCSDVAVRNVIGVRTGVEVLVIVVSLERVYSTRAYAAAAREVMHVTARMRIFSDCALFRRHSQGSRIDGGCNSWLSDQGDCGDDDDKARGEFFSGH